MGREVPGHPLDKYPLKSTYVLGPVPGSIACMAICTRGLPLVGAGLWSAPLEIEESPAPRPLGLPMSCALCVVCSVVGVGVCRAVSAGDVVACTDPL